MYVYNWYRKETRCIDSRAGQKGKAMKETEKIEIMHFSQEGYVEDGKNAL